MYEAEMAHNVRFIRRFAGKFPPFAALLVEQEEFYEEVLPELLLHDVMNWMEDELASDQTSSYVQQILDALEVAYLEEDNAINNMIAVGFVEDIRAGSKIAEMLGPAMRDQYELMH